MQRDHGPTGLARRCQYLFPKGLMKVTVERRVNSANR
jgi:hypothetical protein